jgi:iron complex transport system ATP-binding protein
MLKIEHLAYHYGERAVLSGVGLTVASGEVVSLVGPNGAGKSTLIKCVNTILKPASGVVEIAGRSARSFNRREMARTVAYVPQQVGQAMSMPVIDMIALGRAPHRGLHSPDHERGVVMGVIERLGLQDYAFRLYGELSGGERQRVLIARALAQEGDLMLLDEPTNNLDLRHQLETMSTVAQIAKERSMAVLIAIHDLALAARFSDRLVLLHEGRIHAEGAWPRVLTPENLVTAYGVSAVIGSANGLPYVLPAPVPPAGG